MATTKLGNTKSASRAINYAEKRAVQKDGINCDVDYAKSAFKATRKAFGKDQGVEAHTIIQSFQPGEITPEKANEVGIELAKRVANEYQVAVYTHDDKEHIHNHIVINSVNLETANKYQSNAKQRNLIKEQNDEVCREYGLSVPVRDSARERYTLAEKEILKKGQASWKDELREAVEVTKGQSTSLKDFQSQLQEQFGIEFKRRGKTVSYKHPNHKVWVRGQKLGNAYDKGALEYELERQAGRDQERATTRNSEQQQSDKQRHRRTRQQRQSSVQETPEHRNHTPKPKRANKQDGPELEL